MQHSHHFHGQMSDTFRAAVFVTLSGGFQDAYTYSLVTEFTDIRAIWVCCGLLLISFILMFIRDDRRHERVRTSKPSSGDALGRSRARASYKTGPLLFWAGLFTGPSPRNPADGDSGGAQKSAQVFPARRAYRRP